MNGLRFLLKVLLHVLRTLAYGWVLDLADIVKRLLEALKKLIAYLKLPHADRDEAHKGCDTIDNPAMHRPDPCIYSQEYLLKLGLPVTWDNPDIVIRKGGVPVPENALEPDTDYVIEATIWNNSYEAPAVGLSVGFSFLTFGVATVATAIGGTSVNLGVKGGVNHPALAHMPWRTPPTPGHYCLQVKLDWPDDVNPGNNVGQNNLDVVTPQSPAVFHFTLRNNIGKQDWFAFEVDTYTIPTLPECPTQIGPDDRGPFPERLRRIKARHDKSLFPVPAGWIVTITPPQVSLVPDAEVDITVSITPPAAFAGTKQFNVNANHGAGYAGGVSLIVSTA